MLISETKNIIFCKLHYKLILQHRIGAKKILRIISNHGVCLETSDEYIIDVNTLMSLGHSSNELFEVQKEKFQILISALLLLISI